MLDRTDKGIVRFVDIYGQFFCHGLSEDRWYWDPMISESSAKEATDVRRLWIEEIGL